MKKKSMLSLLCVALTILLVSCTPAPATTPAPAQTAAAATAAPAAATAKPATAAPAATPAATPAKPAAQVKLNVWGPNNMEEFLKGENENNNVIINFIREATGYDVNWIIAPKDQAREALNIMMTSGDPPDVIYSGDKALFNDYASQGLIAELDQLIPATSYISKVVPEGTWNAVRLDGKIYAVPVPQNQHATNAPIVRADWLAKLGLSTPTTIDDYTAMLKAFRDGKLGDNVIPYVAGQDTNNLGAFQVAFQVAVPYMIKDGKLEPTAVSQNRRDYLQYVAMLFKEGLIDKEFAVNKGANITEKLSNGRGGMSTYGWADMKVAVESAAKLNPDINWQVIAPPKDRAGGETKMVMNGPVRVYFLFPLQSKKNKEAVDFLDKTINPDVLNVISYGWKGEHYTVDANGLIVQTEKAEQIRFRIYYNMWDSQENFNNRYKLKGFAPYYEPMMAVNGLDNIVNYAPPIPVVTEKSATLKDLDNEYTVKIITGVWGIEKFDEFVTKYLAAGGQETIDAYNAWYAAR